MLLFSLEKALKLTEGIGTESCADYRRRLLGHHPSICTNLAHHYCRLAKAKSHVEANLMLLRTDDYLKLGSGSDSLYLSCPDDELRDFAKWHSHNLEKLIIRKVRRGSSKTVIQLAIDYLEHRGLTFPLDNPFEASQEEIAGAIARVKCDLWWRQKLRKLQDIKMETVQIEMGQVNKVAGIYASHNCVKRKFAQAARNKDVLAQYVAENDLGQSFTLLDIAERGVSNPVNRRNELMTRIAGFEAIGKARGHKGVFVTLTAPSKYHSFLSKPCVSNPKYQSLTPADAQSYFNGQWRKVRAKLKRDNIAPYGFRVVEPHHDGCPHWHMLLFIEPEKKQALIDTLTHYALQIDGSEAGAETHRIKVEYIDQKKGTAAGYIAKYISKSIDGAKLDADLYGQDAVKSAGRIRAWASAWKIRQFQQIGGPPVTVWRELRRLTAGDKKETALEGLSDDHLRQIADAADTGDWQAFTELFGGPIIARKDQPIRPFEIVKDKPSRYEEAAKQLIGLIYRTSEFIQTRFRTWEIKRKESFNTSATALFSSSGGANAPPLEFCQ
ncbi:replication endonuclease [uncultured Gilvimarinus sp.]|uniref:replication endonuclease n=1 Tax=uncultured Gilvimarinus sp. TaxID=1689143 RepID=UPI0030D9902A